MVVGICHVQMVRAALQAGGASASAAADCVASRCIPPHGAGRRGRGIQRPASWNASPSPVARAVRLPCAPPPRPRRRRMTTAPVRIARRARRRGSGTGVRSLTASRPCPRRRAPRGPQSPRQGGRTRPRTGGRHHGSAAGRYVIPRRPRVTEAASCPQAASISAPRVMRTVALTPGPRAGPGIRGPARAELPRTA